MDDLFHLLKNSGSGRVVANPEPLVLAANPLPWIAHATYLGNVVTGIPDCFSKDAKQKRARYIERNVEIIQEFPFAHPEVKCKMNNIYNSSFPGSVLYDLSSDSVSQLVNSWSVSVRQMWGLPLHTGTQVPDHTVRGHTRTGDAYQPICQISSKYSEVR